MGNKASHTPYYTAENLRQMLEGPVSKKLKITEKEIDTMVSNFSKDPKESPAANYQVTLTYFHKETPYATLDALYHATLPNNFGPTAMNGVGCGAALWIESCGCGTHHAPSSASERYFNVFTISKGKNYDESVPTDYTLQPGDVISLHPTSIVGDNVTHATVDVSRAVETIVTYYFVTSSEQEREELQTRMERFKIVLLYTSIVPVGMKELGVTDLTFRYNQMHGGGGSST